MRENGLIWVLMATLAVTSAFAFIKSAEVQKQLRVQQAQLAAQAQIDKRAVIADCNYRDFLKTEFRSGTVYLAKHPNGIPSIGISRAQIEQSLKKEHKGFVSMRGLVCPGDAPAPSRAVTTPTTTQSEPPF